MEDSTEAVILETAELAEDAMDSVTVATPVAAVLCERMGFLVSWAAVSARIESVVEMVRNFMLEVLNGGQSSFSCFILLKFDLDFLEI